MVDIAKRFAENPILRPADIRPSIGGMKVECLLNPGVFRFDDKTWLLLRVAERPEQKSGKTLPPHNKDCAVFSERIGDKYYALHRPSSQFIGGNYIWLAESPDLVHWGRHRCIAHRRPGFWDSARIGAGAAPIRTPQGRLGNL